MIPEPLLYFLAGCGTVLLAWGMKSAVDDYRMKRAILREIRERRREIGLE